MHLVRHHHRKEDADASTPDAESLFAGVRTEKERGLIRAMQGSHGTLRVPHGRSYSLMLESPRWAGGLAIQVPFSRTANPWCDCGESVKLPCR